MPSSVIVTIVNDTAKLLYTHVNSFIIGYYPSTSCTIVVSHNPIYVTDKRESTKILGIIPYELIQKSTIIYLSEITGITRSSELDFVTGKSGCSSDDFSQRFGIKKQVPKGEYIVNDTPFMIHIYKVIKNHDFNYSPMIIMKNSDKSWDLAKIIPTKSIKVASLIPGSRLYVNTIAFSNDYFELRDSADNCYGTFILKTRDNKPILQKISTLAVVSTTTIKNYQTGPGTCNYAQFSGQYEKDNVRNITSAIQNNTNEKIYIYKVPDTPIVLY